MFCEIYNLTPLDMYNGLSQAYCISTEERIHWYTKVEASWNGVLINTNSY